MSNVPMNWRLKSQRYGLVGMACDACSHKVFPPREFCPECGAVLQTPYTFSGHGEVYSFSTVHQAPDRHEDQAPYTVALIKLEEGPLITAQLTDIDRDAIQIGMPVEMITRALQSSGERGAIVYGYKFRPVLSNEH